MKKILVPCDFSQPAINAFRFALDLASQSNGVVHLIHVIEMPILYDSTIMPALYFEAEIFNDLKRNTESSLKKLISKYNIENVKVVHHILQGQISISLENYIKENSIDQVLMGSNGARGLKEIFIGSNAERMVRHSPVPVFILKDYYKGPIKNIVFPNTLDTESQEDLVMKVKALQNFFKAHLHIVWINTPANFTSDIITRERLTAFAERYMLTNYTISVFNHIDTEEGILQFAKTVKGDLIAMGTNGRTGVSHLLNGSVAENVVNHSDKLVWTYSLKNEDVKV